jgi:hypothetical protein
MTESISGSDSGSGFVMPEKSGIFGRRDGFCRGSSTASLSVPNGSLRVKQKGQAG